MDSKKWKNTKDGMSINSGDDRCICGDNLSGVIYDYVFVDIMRNKDLKEKKEEELKKK